MSKRWRFVVGGLVALALRGALATEPDWGGYGRLLERHLSERTVEGIRLAWLDYTGLKNDPAFLRVVGQLATFPLDRLRTREEQLAFYINAYNILAIKTVLDHWPVESIKDGGNLIKPVWKRPAGEIGGKQVTLDQIEDGLRRQGEPRIHMVIVCASKSCPDLRREPYTAAKLNEQLNVASDGYLNNTTKGLIVEKKAVRVSKIFDWFADDFARTGGIEAFIRAHRSGLPAGLPIQADLPYDWSLNGD